MNKQRIVWIDWAKTICIFLMVCGHSHPTVYVHDFLYQFHLPVFFIISGILYKPKSIKQLCFSLLLPVFIWNLINYPWYLYEIIKNQYELSLETLLIKPLCGLFIHDFKIGIPICGPFWFVLVIFIMRIYQQIIKNSKYLQYTSIILCILIAYVSNEAPRKGILFLFQRAAIAYPFFMAGIYIKDNAIILRIISDFKKIILPCSLIILILFPLLRGSFDLYSCQLNIFPSYYIIGLVGFIFIYIITNYFCLKLGSPKFISNISNGTLVILGLHNITLFTLSKLT